MIRKINKEDEKEFFDMVCTFYSSDAVTHNINIENVRKTFDNAVLELDESLIVHIIEKDDRICGYSILAVYWSNEAGGKTVQIEEIFIKNEFRGKGLAKDYFNFLFEKFDFARRFRLEATSVNLKAINFYKSLGFKALDYEQFVIDK